MVAVTTRFDETSRSTAELPHFFYAGRDRTGDLVINSDVVPSAFVTAFAGCLVLATKFGERGLPITVSRVHFPDAAPGGGCTPASIRQVLF